ncbi:hypothetical protein EIP91_004967, partial [Steccherinum ochraceum]
HYRPPEGVEDLDPYAYDVYCLGETLYNTCRVAQERYGDFSFPSSLHQFIVRQQWSELRNCLLMTKDN